MGAAVPGRGGVSRGRGDAEMIWGEETPGRSDLFAVETLRGARYRDEDHTLQFGVGATAPAEDVHEEGVGAAEGLPSADGGAAWRRRLAPRHRSAVREFFGPGHETEGGGKR